MGSGHLSSCGDSSSSLHSLAGLYALHSVLHQVFLFHVQTLSYTQANWLSNRLYLVLLQDQLTAPQKLLMTQRAVKGPLFKTAHDFSSLPTRSRQVYTGSGHWVTGDTQVLLSEKSQKEKPAYVWSLFIRQSKKGKVVVFSRSCQGGFQVSGEMNLKDHQGTFWSDTNVLHYDYGDGHMMGRICQMSLNCTIKSVN